MSIEYTIGFYLIKVISIFIVSILYFISGSIFSVLLNEVIPDDKPQDLSSIQLLLEVSSIFGLIGIVFYFNRILIKKIPFFLDGLYGFKYSLLHEAAGGIIVGYILYAYQDKLVDKLTELRKRYLIVQTQIVKSVRSLSFK
jgi:hypothetical protein